MAERSGLDEQFERIKLEGEQVLEHLKRIVQEGSVTRIIVRHDDRVVAEFPLVLGAAAAVFAPVLAAVGAIVALLANCTIEAERRTDSATDNGKANTDGGETPSSGGTASSAMPTAAIAPTSSSSEGDITT